MENLLKRIQERSVTVGIIGLGYVGLPLAMAVSKNFTVLGYDVNKNTIDLLQIGESHIFDISKETIKSCINNSFFPTDNPIELKQCDIIIICVPTPLTEDKIPDLSYVKDATETVAKILNKGQFVILESTTYLGTTDEVVISILEESGLKGLKTVGKRIFGAKVAVMGLAYKKTINDPKGVPLQEGHRGTDQSRGRCEGIRSFLPLDQDEGRFIYLGW